MMPQPGTWADVRVESYIIDKNGAPWRVEAEQIGFEDAKLRLVNPQGERSVIVRPPATAPVTLLVPTEAEALELVKTELGAEHLAEKPAGSPGWKVYGFPKRSLGLARAHMFMLHGAWVEDVKSIKQLTEYHDESHADPDPLFFVQHLHI
jgi:hypothetical protein